MAYALLSTLSLLTLSTAVSAADFSQWQAPGPNDVRSPCPGLNALANHGILPRSGRGMTVPILIQGLQDGMNVGADFATAIGTGGLLSSPAAPLATSFDLDNLDQHNLIEHDASLSRTDFFLTGNDHSFNQSIFDTVLAYYSGMSMTSIPVAAKARYNRVNTERGRDPRFTYTVQQFVLSYGETALYLSVLGDPVTGVAPVDWVKIFFEQERLPYAEGWSPRLLQTNLVSLATMILGLNAATGEEVPEGLLITNNTLGDAFSGLNPITGAVAGAVSTVKSSSKRLGLL